MNRNLNLLILKNYHQKTFSNFSNFSTIGKSSLSSSSPSSSKLLDQAKAIFSETSGDHEISKLKQKVYDLSQSFDEATQGVSDARVKAHVLQTKLEDVQKEHTSLMMRRDGWTEEDTSRFADITHQEVKVRRELEEARLVLKKSEKEQEIRQIEYMDAVRMRYHEEQIWQDKWRVISTYGTWLLIGLNSIIFIAGQYFNKKREEERMLSLESILSEKLSNLTNNQLKDESTIKNKLDVINKESNQEEIDCNKNMENNYDDSKMSPSDNEQALEDASYNGGDTHMVVSSEISIEEEESIEEKRWKNKMNYVYDESKRFLYLTFNDFHFPSAAVGATLSLILVSVLSSSKKR